MTVKQRLYADGFKEQALAKAFARSDAQSARSIAADLGMSMGTLGGWMKRALRDQKSPLGEGAACHRLDACAPAQRLLALHESHGLSEEALNAWCRERGLFAHDLTPWHSEFCESGGAVKTLMSCVSYVATRSARTQAVAAGARNVVGGSQFN